MKEISTTQIANSFSSIDSLQFLLTKERIDTNHKRFMHQIFRRCQDKGLSAGIVDLEGRGKSTAIAEYYHSNENVFYVRVGQSYKNKRFVQELIYMVSGSFPSPSIDIFILIKHLSWLLTQDTSRKLIIVDDAGKLQPTGLGHFHELITNTQSCASFAFVGLPYFKLNLESWMAKGVQGIGEFYRRIETWYEEFPLLTREEKVHYCKVKGINSQKASNDICTSTSAMWQLEFMVNKFLEVGEDDAVLPEPIKPKQKKFSHDD
jgi:hypothetical protein